MFTRLQVNHKCTFRNIWETGNQSVAGISSSNKSNSSKHFFWQVKHKSPVWLEHCQHSLSNVLPILKWISKYSIVLFSPCVICSGIHPCSVHSNETKRKEDRENWPPRMYFTLCNVQFGAGLIGALLVIFISHWKTEWTFLTKWFGGMGLHSLQ